MRTRLTGILRAFAPACLLLAAGCARVDTGPEPGGFVAVLEREERTVTLDFSRPPDFVLTFAEKGERLKRDKMVTTTLASFAGNHRLYKFVGKEVIDKGPEQYVCYSYKNATNRCDDIYIWTDIKSVTPENLDYMKIDRAPFCIVVAVNEAGGFPLPMNRKDAKPGEKYQASGPIPFRKDGKCGYRDPTNTRVVIGPRFDRADPFSACGRARVVVGGRNGYIDTTGRYIVEPSLDYSQPFGEIGEPDLAAVKRDGKHGVINASGKFVVELKYDAIGYNFVDGVIDVKIDGKQGFIRKDGKIIVEPIYEKIWSFSEGVGSVLTKDGWGFVDTDGKFVIAPQFKRVGMFFEGLASAQLKTGKWGFIDKTGKFVIEPRFDYADLFSCGLAEVAMGVNMEAWEDHGDASGKWGFIDETGKVAIEMKYDHVSRFEGERTDATLKGVDGYLYKDGRFEPYPKHDE